VGERRFLVDPADVGAGRAIVRGEEHHHLARVLRLRPGAEVAVFDGRGAGFAGRIESVEPTRAIVKLGDPEDPRIEPELRVTLLQAIVHGERMDWIVEKATEIGAARIVPVVSERSVVKPRSGTWTRLDRWRRIALSAAKQSGRLIVPELADPIAFEDAISDKFEARAVTGTSGDSHSPSRLIFHPSGGPLATALRGVSHAAIALLVGPEGGFTGDEHDRSVASGWKAVGLGRCILRADTAATIALGLVLGLHVPAPADGENR
jgi:16S rRNA (uracil1498-N3)-methyltransferase